MRNPLASSSTTGTIHAFLLLLRLIVALTSYSIIHPDEYFQNPEIGAAMVFNYPRDYSDGPLKTWEWLGDAPCRGVGVVTGSTALPFWILKRIVGEDPSARALFVAQRLAIFCLSITIDSSISTLSPNSDLPLLLFASSPLAFTFLLRPFSNSIETMMLGSAIAHYVRYSSRSSTVSSARGSLRLLLFDVALGVWTRITFLAFVAPLLLGVVALAFIRAPVQYSVYRRFQHFATRIVLPVLPSLVIHVAILILTDMYYFKLPKSYSITDLITSLTPLNSLRFNLSTSNLALHGLHPRYLHFLVNWPFLFGVGLVLVGEAAIGIVKGIRVASEEPTRNEISSNTYAVLLAVFIVPTALLSIQPHQEPRFLVPLIIPLVLLCGRSRIFKLGTTGAARRRKWLWTLWISHSIIVTILYGYLHQGGLVPALFRLNYELRQPGLPFLQLPATDDDGSAMNYSVRSKGEAIDHLEIVFWKTFMPPRHLLIPPGAPNPNNTLQWIGVVDHSSAASSLVIADLSARVSNMTPTNGKAVILVTPAWAFDQLDLTSSAQSFTAVPLFRQSLSSSSVIAGKVTGEGEGEETTFGFHLDTDEFGEVFKMSWARSGVGVWRII